MPFLPRRFHLILLSLLLCACTTRDAVVEPTPVEVPLHVSAVQGTLAMIDGTPINGRAVTLCAVLESDTACDVIETVTSTAGDGTFAFEAVATGKYVVLVGAAGADLSGWADREVRRGDWQWVSQELLSMGGEGSTVAISAPAQMARELRVPYALDVLMFEGAPFSIAHTMSADGSALPFVLDVGEAGVPPVRIITEMPGVRDLAAVRATIGALTREEARMLDPQVATRWNAFIGGDDTSYSDSDQGVIEALRAGSVNLIGDTLLTPIDVYEGDLVKSVGYMVFDAQTGAPTLVAVRDAATGDVIEVSTGYRLNVRDNPGEWITNGPNGEQFYHFGWSYYRRWRRILPDPFITQAERFRTVGSEHVRVGMAGYQEAAANYDEGDLTLLAWDDTTIQAAANWIPNADSPPYIAVPDSGVIDVRRERFIQAVESRAVYVDEASVIRFLEGDVARNGFFYTPDLTVQGVIDRLLMPYRSAHLYTDFEAAIILDATYGGTEPLVIRVTGQMPDGALVPRRFKQIFFADGEVADVILGYPGTLTARWPHEMGHILHFRDERNDYPMRPVGGSRCEPFLYMMEYMWWIERFPYDAPDWDWQPVGSGLTLARLLTGTYPNSGC